MGTINKQTENLDKRDYTHYKKDTLFLLLNELVTVSLERAFTSPLSTLGSWDVPKDLHSPQKKPSKVQVPT